MNLKENCCRIMETEDHFKNGASQKSQMSKVKTRCALISCKITLKVLCMLVLFGVNTRLPAQDVNRRQNNNQSNQVRAQDYPQVLNIRDRGRDSTSQAQSAQQNNSQMPVPPNSKKNGFSIHAGGVFPVGFFAEEPAHNELDGGFSASTGFNVGIKGKIPLSVDGLGIFISGDFIYNGLKGSLKSLYDDAEISADKVKKPRYLNIPLFAGLNHKINIDQTYSLWIEGGLGPNLRIITPTKITEQEYDRYGSTTYTTEVKYDMQASFAFQFGAGIMINDIVSFGLHYYGLGNSKIKGKFTETTSDGDIYTEYLPNLKKYSQNCLIVRIGIHF